MNAPISTYSSHLPAGSTVSALLFGAVIIAGLYFGREVLVPIALAILLSFALAPLVRFFQAWRIPRMVAVPFVVIASFAAILVIGAVMVAQMNQLATDLPRYQSTLREKIQAVRGVTTGGGTLEKAAEVLQELGTELNNPAPGRSAGTRGQSDTARRPVPVEIRQPDPGALQTLVTLITPLVHPLATTGIVFIFVIFILLQREDLRNRLVRLAGVRDLQRTTAALDDAGRRLSRFFLTQLALNAAFGLVIGVGLFVIGVPSAPLWGILAMILRFVPYIGAAIAAIFPLVLAAAVGPDWSMVLWTAALFAVVEPLTGHLIEPLLAGHSSGLSPVAVIASATFWTWLWGPIGLVLATPLTVCLVVMGRHVDRLKFLDVMFGDEPALSPAELVYQRMLAGDAVEVTEQAELYLEEQPLPAFYADVLLESLQLAQRDAQGGELDQDRLARLREVSAALIDDLSAYEEPEPDDAEAPAVSGPPVDAALLPGWEGETPVLCIPGPGVFDELLARIVAQLVTRQGLGARAEPADALSLPRISALKAEDTALACLCYVGSGKPASIRYAVKRLRRNLPRAQILVAITVKQNGEPGSDLQLSLPDWVTVKHSLRDTVDDIVARSRAPAPVEGGVAKRLERRSERVA